MLLVYVEKQNDPSGLSKTPRTPLNAERKENKGIKTEYTEE